MSSFLDRLKAREGKADRAKPVIDLRGSGIRSRDLERSTERYDREVAKAIEKGGDELAQHAVEQFQEGLNETLRNLLSSSALKNIVLDPSQITAFNGCVEQQVCCLIGAAGTGKTTLTRLIISALSQKVGTVDIDASALSDDETVEEKKTKQYKKIPAIAVAAFTGRAAQQARKAIGVETEIPIMTIHKMLGYEPTMIEVEEWDPITKSKFMKAKRVFRPTFGRSCKLPYKCIILDEASMIPIPLFNEIIDATTPDCRIILIGDIHQLPPVMSKSVLGYALQKWPVFELKKIHRQAEGNAIIANAHRILNGQMIQKASNVHLIESPAQSSTEFATFVRQITQLLWAKRKAFDPYKDVIIVPNSNPDIITSAPALNMHFVTMFNEEKKEGGVIPNKRITIHTGTAEAYFAVGDLVMMGQNINTVSPPITNGMRGIVESVNVNGKYDQKRSQVDYDEIREEVEAHEIRLDDEALDFELEAAVDEIAKKREKEEESRDQRQSSHVMTIRFETGQVHHCSTAGDFRKIMFGYAITCHKSQGGEYPTTIIALHSANGALLSQEWLYTAFTRARENVFIIFNKRGLKRAIETQKIKGKTLEEKLRAYVIESKSDDVKLNGDPWNVDRSKFPILFNPRKV